MTFQHPFQHPSNGFQHPTVTHPHTPRGVGSAPLEDGAQLGPKARRPARRARPPPNARYFSAASRGRIAFSKLNHLIFNHAAFIKLAADIKIDMLRQQASGNIGATIRRFSLLAHAQSVERPSKIKAAVTNDPLMLRGVDGRSVVARRYRDVAIALADDLGGQDKLSEPSKILVRQAAALTVQVETLQSKIVAGEEVSLEQLTRLSNVLGRTLQRLGLRKPRARPTNPLAAHFAEPPKAVGT
jgi:hypothetical protein